MRSATLHLTTTAQAATVVRPVAASTSLITFHGCIEGSSLAESSVATLWPQSVQQPSATQRAVWSPTWLNHGESRQSMVFPTQIAPRRSAVRVRLAPSRIQAISGPSTGISNGSSQHPLSSLQARVETQTLR